MAFIHLTDVSLAFGDRDILNEIHFSLHTGDRKCVAGTNGSGKSTLLKIAAGIIQADSGSRSVSPDTRIGYLSQHGIVHTGASLREEAEKAFEYFHRKEEERIILEEKISSIKEGDDVLNPLLHKHFELNEQLSQSGYYYRNNRIESVLSGLGFSSADFEKPAQAFSGGWQMRIALGKLLLSNPDFLLLDEPTNYLDLEARNWLESFIQSYHGGCCIVSHDRFFLDATITEVIEVFQGNLNNYPGTYSQFERKRDERLMQLEKLYSQQQEEIQKITDFIERFRYNDSKASQVQSRIKMLEKIDPVEIPPAAKRISLRFPSPPHSGKHVVRLNNLSREYNGQTVFKNVNLEFMRGEKIVLTGRNGTGKSTLMRIIADKDDGYTGEIRYGTDVRIGYFSQDFDKQITGDVSIIEHFETQAPTELVPKLRDMLGGFLFHDDDIHKHLSVLSGGEKSRIAMLQLLLSPVNLLILDEPTNHLDLHSKDVLLEALDAYPGTVIFVSHDRDFISRLAGRVIHLGEDPVKSYPGDYEYFLSHKPEETDPVGELDKNEEPTTLQLTRDERKRIKAQIKQLSAREHDLLDELDSIANEKKDILAEMSDPQIYKDGDAVKVKKDRLEAAERKEVELNEEWELVSEELQQLHNELPEG